MPGDSRRDRRISYLTTILLWSSQFVLCFTFHRDTGLDYMYTELVFFTSSIPRLHDIIFGLNLCAASKKTSMYDITTIFLLAVVAGLVFAGAQGRSYGCTLN
jgi:hypothetical protein